VNVVDPITLLILLAVLAIGEYAILSATSSAASESPEAIDSVFSLSGVPAVPQHIESSNPSTWPQGNRIWDISRAIAFAEGYDQLGSNPSRLNNPGDISDGVSTYGSEQHSGSSVTSFPDALTGWTWLYAKIRNIANGNSAVYDPSMSWNEIGEKWAPPNASTWAANVATNLGVDADSSLNDYINS
jgi:hypothetical protein